MLGEVVVEVRVGEEVSDKVGVDMSASSETV